MDLKLNETQTMLKQVTADFVKAEAPSHILTQWYLKKETAQIALYRKAAGLGWLGMVLPEEYGGAATSFTDCAVVFEELGRGPLPGPFFSSGVLSALLVHQNNRRLRRRRHQALCVRCRGSNRLHLRCAYG